MGTGRFGHCIYGWICSAAIVLVLFSAQSIAAPVPADTTTIRVLAGDLPKLKDVQILSRIDYGAFSLIEVPTDTITNLKSAKVRFQKEHARGRVGLQGREFDVRSGPTDVARDLKSTAQPGTPTFYIVHLPGPVKRDWLKKIETAGGKIVSYIPENSYLVWIDPSRIPDLDKTGLGKWTGLYHPAYKIAKSLEGTRGQIDRLSVVIYDDPAGKTIEKIKSFGAKFERMLESPLGPGIPAVTAVFSADTSLIPKIARLPRVVRLDVISTVGLDDERADKVVIGNHLDLTARYSTWLNTAGVTGNGSTVSVIDTGLDSNDNQTVHLDLLGRLTTAIIYDVTPPVDLFGHGTHVAGIIAGSGATGMGDDESLLYGLGVAPGANLVIQNATCPDAPFPPWGGGWTRLTSDAVFAQPYGAFAANNSWNINSTPAQGYTSICATFDSLVRDADLSTENGIQQIAMVFSAGNAGSGSSTLLEPKEAKNIITVGASENFRPNPPLGPSYGICGTCTDINGVAAFSSRGPCVDGRIAPTLVAPGTSISSTASRFASYNGGGCKAYVDPETKNYAWMSGTSQAAPMVTGALALIAEWWRRDHPGNPSPAMCKAILVNGADDMYNGPDGRGGNLDHIPNGDQGWGRLNIPACIDPPDTSYEDQIHAFTETGQSRSYKIRAADPNKPLKITIAWTDAPGTPGVHAWANDLDLVATGGSGAYLGNDFLNGWSVPGVTRDEKNNVECIYLQQPSGEYLVTVIAANIAADGIPGNDASTDQDFALVVRNGVIDATTLSPYTPVESPASPEPDHFRMAVPSGGWSALALQPAADSDHDLAICTDPSWSTTLIGSSTRSGGIEIIALDGNRGLPLELYPMATTFSGSGGYSIEWATRTADLVPGTANASFTQSELLRVWDLELIGPTTGVILITPTSGNLDVGACIFASTAGQSNTYYRTLPDALFSIAPNGLGGPKALSFTITEAGRHGVVVWKGSGSGDYTITFDTDAPTQPTVTPDFLYTDDPTSLGASWSSNDPESGITKYEYKIGTSPGAGDTVDWTDAGTATHVLRNDLNLAHDKSYYFTVRATNGIGMLSQEATSGPILVPVTTATISDAKALPDGTAVKLTSKTTTARFADRFYISETERTSGIGVKWTNAVAEGVSMTVVGKLVTIEGERFIEAVVVTTE